MKKLNLKQMGIAYLGATVTSVPTGLVFSYAASKFGYNVDYGLNTALLWLGTIGIPSTLIAAEHLRRTLGEKKDAIIKRSSTRIGGRKIPVNSGSGKSDIFMSVMPWIKPNPIIYNEEETQITSFVIEIDGISYTVLWGEMEDFIRGIWARQRVGKPGMSRPYWTKQYRPSLTTKQYNARVKVLLDVNGLILDRGQGRSGRLSISPLLALKELKWQ